MGTRNLTMVIDQSGVKKVAQYGQWDGYPSGVGVNILNIIKDTVLFEKLKQNLNKVRFLDKDGVDKDFIENYNRNAPEWGDQPDNRTKQQIEWFDSFCSRDLAEEVLINIANSTETEIILIDRENTAKGDGWVEYSYVVNLQENTFSVYEHVDQRPLKVYSLDNLPENDVFISDLTPKEE